MRAPRGLFVTGTDTGVGKTLVACELIRRLRGRGVDACGMKPVETGVGPDGPQDALALRAAAGGGDPLDDVCPQRFALPAAPRVAAEVEGTGVDVARIDASFARLAARHECVIAEGAGGLLVPISDGVDMATLASRLGLPLLVVARARLGTINHTLLTLEVGRARGLGVAGVVVSRGEGPLSSADLRNLERLRSELSGLWIGDIPPLEPGQRPPDAAIDLDALLDRIGRGD